MFLLVLFIFVGIFGLVFKVDEGVFIGLALIPWQVRVVLAFFKKKNRRLIEILIWVSVIVGVAYFIFRGRWIPAIAMFGVQSYVYKIISKPAKKETTGDESDSD